MGPVVTLSEASAGWVVGLATLGVGQHVGYAQGAGRGVIPADQVDPLDRDDEGLGHRVAKMWVGQALSITGVAQVPDFDPYRRHLGAPQQVPGAGVAAAVNQVSAGHDLALDQRGQVLAGD